MTHHNNFFKGRRIVVVGASSGIGLAVCHAAAAHGAEVVMLARSAERLYQEAASTGSHAVPYIVDMLDRSALNKAMGKIGTIDGLVLTAVSEENARSRMLSDVKTPISKPALTSSAVISVPFRLRLPILLQMAPYL